MRDRGFVLNNNKMARASEVSSSWGSHFSGLWEVCSGNGILEALLHSGHPHIPHFVQSPSITPPSTTANSFSSHCTVVPLPHSGIGVNRPGPPHSTFGSVPLLSSHCGALTITTEVSPHSGIRVLTSTYMPETQSPGIDTKECGFEYLRRCVSPAGLGRGHPAPRILAICCNVKCRILNSPLNVLCSCPY